MHEILQTLLHDALLGAGTILATALVALIASWMQKHGIEMTAAQHDFAMKVAEDGFHLAEEKIANGMHGGQTKLEIATDFVTAKTGLSAAEARDVVHAALASSGSGATDAPAVAAPVPFDPTKSTPK